MTNVQTVFVLCLALAQPGRGTPGIPNEDEVRRMLKAIDNFDEGPKLLKEYGAELFPTYSRIIRSRNYTGDQLACIFGLIADVKADRSRFVEDAVSGLTHDEALVRRSALQLLAQIGSARDAAPVAALLADPEISVVFRAAQTLSAIGDRRALTALDVWLVCGQGRDVRELRERVSRFREELRRRLDAALPIAPPPRSVVP